MEKPDNSESYDFLSARFGGHSVWENRETVFEVQRRESRYRVVMYSKKRDELNFVEVAYYKDPEKLYKLIKKLKLDKVQKRLSLRNGQDD